MAASDPYAIQEQQVYHAYSAHQILRVREDSLEAAIRVYNDELAVANRIRQRAWDAALAKYKDAVADIHRIYTQEKAKLDDLTAQMAEYAVKEDDQ